MANKGQFDRMQKLQNRAMRIILKCNNRTSIKSMLEALGWMNVKQRIFFRMLVVVFKIKHKMMPKYLTDEITYVGDLQTHLLRNAEDFSVPAVNKQQTRNSVMNKGLMWFNKLPNDLKNETNLKTYKRLLKEYIKEKVK